MIRITALAALTFTLVAAPAHATEVGSSRTVGIGFQLGDPTALIGKLFIGHGNALDAGIGFASFGYARCRDGNGHLYHCDDAGFVSVHADYLWQDNLVRQGNLKLDWHIGVGGRIIFDNAADRSYVYLIARMPLGLDFAFARPGFIEPFAEIAPGVVIIPPLWLDIDIVLGIRFFF
jgi:hypothetical protein